jgi:6-phosphofructokinase 1
MSYTIGVFTSGGDAPGMNACVRAVVRTAVYRGARVIGIHRGYTGLLAGQFEEMTPASVSNIIQLGGTILRTSRCDEFLTPEGRAKGAAYLREAGIEGLVAIGGDGTFRGAHALYLEHGIPTVGTPGTIDNDLYGTDYTIGFDTAVNTALDSIDRLRDTASSHERMFVVEVMGRQAGFIALAVGASGGAEEIMVPECRSPIEEVHQRIMEGRKRGKTSSIIVVAEGDEEGGALQIAESLRRLGGLEVRVSILGHIQRGGSPTAADRILGSKLGAAAVDGLLAGRKDVMAGGVNGRIVYTPLPETWEKKKPIDEDLLRLNTILAT